MVGLAWFVALAVGCQRGSAGPEESVDTVLARLSSAGRALDATLGGGRVRYLGFEATPEGASPNDRITIAHYWVTREPLNHRYRVFVHLLLDGAAGWVKHGDHDPIPSPDRWPPGRVIRDEHRLRLPERLPGTSLDLRVGLYSGHRRLPVDRPEHHDGRDRLLAGRIPVAGTPVPRPSYRAPQLSRPPLLDGVVNEMEWGGAAWSTPFVASRGGAAMIRTRARLAWDVEHLYLAFETSDPDIQATLTARDDPVYREEALEIFIDAGATGRDYVELQASPRGTLFDAAFSGGPRRNMRVGFDAAYRVAVHLDGTLNDAGDRDQGWTSEWAIPLRSLSGARVDPGRPWRINLFRVAKDRAGGRQISDESAWSPPLMGDFHNLERFGELWFVAAERSP
jgi:hypothetical protein